MMQIRCPHCGLRDEDEFSCGYTPSLRPELATDDASWARYLFPGAGHLPEQLESWCHSFGCGQWFDVTRDQMSHRFIESDPT